MRLDTKGEAPIWVLPATLRQLADEGDDALVAELIAEFQTDSARRLTSIGSAIAAGDFPKVKLEAHTVKGSALQVGAQRLAGRCQQLELAAGRAEAGALAPLLEAVLHSFDEVRAELAAQGAVDHGE